MTDKQKNRQICVWYIPLQGLSDLFIVCKANPHRRGMPQLIGAGFALAGNEHDQIDQQVEDGMRALLDVPADGLEEALR